MKNETFRLKISLVFVVCIMIPIYVSHGAEIQRDEITFTRQGVVIEARNDPAMPLQAQVQSDTGSIPVEALPIDDARLFLQFAWQPATSYDIRINSLNLEGRHISPLKPSVYRIRMIELDSMLSLLANLKRPAVPTTVAFSPDGSQLAIGTDAGHLAIVNPLTGEKSGRRESPKVMPSRRHSVPTERASISVNSLPRVLSTLTRCPTTNLRYYGSTAQRTTLTPRVPQIRRMCTGGYSIREHIAWRRQTMVTSSRQRIIRGRRMARA